MLSQELLLRYDKTVPRYTSYPPATSFHSAFTSPDYIRLVEASNNAEPQNISLYVHIPFCLQRCHFCGCNTVLYPREKQIAEYVNCVIQEIKMVAPHISRERKVSQVSWGGGTPNSIRYEYLERIMNTFREHFTFDENAEIAIECSPAYLEPKHIELLRHIGFNRISLGIQDFHPPVLKAINRKASFLPEDELLQLIKEAGFTGTNIDLVYGLPLQSVASFDENIDHILELRPDRLATFSYAHVPWFNEKQRILEQYRLPLAQEKFAMLSNTIERMTKAGYVAVGMDHFALPNDALAVARKEGNLHRNFQGYNTKATAGQVYAFGASGISQLDGAYAQNSKSTEEYIKHIQAGELPIERGYEMSFNDKVVRDVINEIMCNGVLEYQTICTKYQLSLEDFMQITQFRVENVQQALDDELLLLDNNGLKLTTEGMMIVRNIAVAFDPAYEEGKGRFSRSL